VVHFVHKHFWYLPARLIWTQSSASVPAVLHPSLSRACVSGLTTNERYSEAARDVRTFLEGRRRDLATSLRLRMAQASEAQRYEEAGSYRDLLHTIEEIDERQKIDAAEGTISTCWLGMPNRRKLP